MSLIVQPDDGIRPVVAAIQRAKTSIDIGIFRLDRGDIAQALRAAVARGVPVRTLIAHKNRGGAKRLRKLEQQLLKTGASVRRTDDDLRRYHNKIMIVDRRTLYVLGFNYTALDVNKRPQLRSGHAEARAGPGGDQALRSRLAAQAVYDRRQAVPGEPDQRPASGWACFLRGRPQAIDGLRPQAHRPDDDPDPPRADEVGRQRSDPRQGGKARRRAHGREVSRQAAARARDHPRRKPLVRGQPRAAQARARQASRGGG